MREDQVSDSAALQTVLVISRGRKVINKIQDRKHLLKGSLMDAERGP